MPTVNTVAALCRSAGNGKTTLNLFRFSMKLLAAAGATVVLSMVLLTRTLSTDIGAMAVRNGDWETSVSTGSDDADVMLKAAVAMGGLLASTRENSMYYRLSSLNGEPLRLDCRYRISGDDYDADWWSITAYGWDNYLIPNAQNRYSFNNENLRRQEDGRWEIVVATTPQQGNWLPVGPAGAPAWRRFVDYDFDLLLRLYTPGPAYLETPRSAPLPKVTEEDCR